MSAIARHTEQPLSVHSDKAELRQTICDAAVSVLSGEYGDALYAIVLTGSMARDEATCVWDRNSWKILGDAEFLLSFKKNRQPSTAEDLQRVGHRIESLLQLQKIQCSVDLGPVPPDYFKELPPHIFSFELKCCGKQVFGQTDVLSQISDFSAAQISREDAWQLLCNRLLELLECGESLLAPETAQTEQVRYKLIKLYLDMATTLLIFSGQYAPTYEQRCASLLRLVEREARADGPDLDLATFAKQVSLCTRAKLNPEGVGQDAPSLSVREAIRTAHALWRWELRQLTGAPASATDRQLIREFSSKHPVIQRLRGWAFAVRAVGLARSLRQVPRWLRLATKGSPRSLVYSAGTTLLFDCAKSTGLAVASLEIDFSSLVGSLPTRSLQGMEGSNRDWNNLAQIVFENYRKFVLKTRA